VEDRRDGEENMTENIADVIREDRRPEGEMYDLSREAKRLRSALAVAQRWLEVAEEEDETGALVTRAEYTRDQLEEELSRTAFRMEALRQWRVLTSHERPVEDLEGTARAGVLSDSLLRVYCLLRDVPAEAFGGDSPEQERYALMGALMVAQEAANKEMERAVGKRTA
jgi:hypothetical protein